MIKDGHDNLVTVEILGMIYRSTKYLRFMENQISKNTPIGKDVKFTVIANDPTQEVEDSIGSITTNFITHHDCQPHDYYLNRVYRAWNFGGMHSTSDVIVFVNSDMAYHPKWLEELVKGLYKDTIPCSKLIESGKMLSGKHAISENFGRSPETFDQIAFSGYSDGLYDTSVYPDFVRGGLYMPCAFYTKDFKMSGGYPEGNIYDGGVGKVKTRFIESGDHHFFYENKVMSKKIHTTVNCSLVYHFQEGEKDA